MRLLSFARNCVYVTPTVRINYQIMKSHLVREVLVRLALLLTFCYLETLESYHRSIPREELWHYKYPHHGNSISTPVLFAISTGIPSAFILAYYVFYKDTTDLIQGLLGLVLAFLLNGVVLDVIKLSVGRPRPDFFYRCFLHGEATPDLQCNGDPDMISEGRKSFPSGHSGWMFAGFGYLSLYLAGKLNCFTQEGRSQSWRLITVLTPLLSSAVVAISRLQDHMHHWEDITVGSLLGFLIAFICYRHHFPSIFDPNSSIPFLIQSDSPLPISNSSLMMMTPPSRNQLPVASSRLQLNNDEKTL